MAQRTFKLITVHGDTDEAATRVRHEAQEDEVTANFLRIGVTHVRRDLVCAVQAIWEAEDGGRVVIHVQDWSEAALLTPGAEATFSF